MRPGRRIMAAVVALWLLGPVPALACGWVLWVEQSTVAAADYTWTISQATTTEAACRAAAARINAALKGLPEGPGGTLITRSGKLIRHVCLPGTLNPRR